MTNFQRIAPGSFLLGGPIYINETATLQRIGIGTPAYINETSTGVLSFAFQRIVPGGNIMIGWPVYLNQTSANAERIVTSAAVYVDEGGGGSPPPPTGGGFHGLLLLGVGS